ncbi:NADPH-dependent F420 reductase [Arthrobacter zhaoguopingii]|uniref:NADPH-dependent F420 reductase n=1 Tax=Arthrobacter zhaoguopingii TaxID=2681491 RepID=UPI00135681BE|nr:NAD(P)-binding domain-containing protein [Arthrobacter zhaoguopingii]
MSVGIVGGGTVAQAVARHASAHGYHVTISNSRGPETLRELAHSLGDNVTAGSVPDALAADMVILALPFSEVPKVGNLRAGWTGTIIVDATNQYASPTRDGNAERANIGDLTGSEWVAGNFPGAAIVKAFNAMFGRFISSSPIHPEGRQVVLCAGDDESTNGKFTTFAERLGFAPVLLGGLREGGSLIQLDGALSGKHMLLQA